MSKKCCLGCRKNGTVFRFPEEEKRRQQWFQAINMEYTITARFLCERHFSASQFENKLLSRTAVPDINLNFDLESMAELEENDATDKSHSDTVKSMHLSNAVSPQLLLTDKEVETYVTPDKLIKVVPDGNEVKLVKNSQTPKATLEMMVTTKEHGNIKKLPKLLTKKNPTVTAMPKLVHFGTVAQTKTPMATLEMKLITKEFEKIEELRKLPVIKKNSVKNDNVSHVPKEPHTAPVNVESKKPRLSDNDWKTQAEMLRKTVEEKLKQSSVIEKENVQKKRKYSRTAPRTKRLIKQGSCSSVLTCVTQASQTESEGLLTCAFVQRSANDNKFCLTCFHCSVVYELSDWEQYIIHYNDTHSSVKESPIYQEEIVDKKPKQISKPKLVNISETYSLSEVKELNTTGDEDNFEVDTVSVSNCGSEISTNQIESAIDFYKSDKKRILKFLKILRAHPLLWHRRRYGPSIYDEELKKFLNEFDKTMSTEDFHNSLNNARDFHKRFHLVTELKQLKLANEPELQQYIEQLNDIVTLSKSCAYYCDNCYYYFFSENDLLKHKFKRHKIGDISHVCSCGLHFADAKGKDAHEATHNTQPSFNCEHCDLSFFSQKKLDNHIVLNHPDAVPNPKPYKCPKCDQSFAKIYILKWHVLKHEPPKYKCDICGKAYHKGFDFKRHMRAHLNQRDYICEDCGNRYLGKSDLRYHRFAVHKKGENCCLPCRTHFVNYENMYAHMQKYHPDGANLDRQKKQHAVHMKKYQERIKAAKPAARSGPRRKSDLNCKQCGVIFPSFGQLQKHKRELEHFMGYRNFRCIHCKIINKSYESYQIHLRKIHKLPTKYSDVQNVEQDEDNFEESVVEVMNEITDVNVDGYGYHETNDAAQNLVEICNEFDEKKPFTTAVANFEDDVQYTVTFEQETSDFQFKIENETCREY